MGKEDYDLECLTTLLQKLLAETDFCYDAFTKYLQQVQKAFESLQESLGTIHNDVEKSAVPPYLRGTKSLILGITANAPDTLFLHDFAKNFADLEQSRNEWLEKRAKILEQAADKPHETLLDIRKRWAEAAKRGKRTEIGRDEQIELSGTIAPFQLEAVNARKVIEDAIAASQAARKTVGDLVQKTMAVLSGHVRVKINPMAMGEVSETQRALQDAMAMELDFSRSLEACVMKAMKLSKEDKPSYFALDMAVKRDAKARLLCDYQVDGIVLPEKSEVTIISADYRKMWTVETRDTRVSVPSTILEFIS